MGVGRGRRDGDGPLVGAGYRSGLHPRLDIGKTAGGLPSGTNRLELSNAGVSPGAQRVQSEDVQAHLPLQRRSAANDPRSAAAARPELKLWLANGDKRWEGRIQRGAEWPREEPTGRSCETPASKDGRITKLGASPSAV